MPEFMPAPDLAAVSLLNTALEKLDGDGETLAAAYVTMALTRISRRADPLVAE